MSQTSTHKFSKWFLLIIGCTNILMWIILILTGQVKDFAAQPVRYIFHWISEFATAVLLITAAFCMFRRKPVSENLLFLSLGFLLIAIGGAFVYYMVNFDLPVFIMTAVISALTILVIILNYKGIKNFLYLTVGLTCYTLINVTGDYLQDQNIRMLIYVVPALFFLMILLVGIPGKEMVFRYFAKNHPPEADSTDVKQ